jgi:hypothetical protein
MVGLGGLEDIVPEESSNRECLALERQKAYGKLETVLISGAQALRMHISSGADATTPLNHNSHT